MFPEEDDDYGPEEELAPPAAGGGEEGAGGLEYAVVAYGDDGAPAFRGTLEYADGGWLGIRRAGGVVTEWPLDLVQVQG